MSAQNPLFRPFPGAARLVEGAVGEMRERSPRLDALARRLHAETGTWLTDWVDHLGVSDDHTDEANLRALGFARRARGPHPDDAFVHEEALLPPLSVLSKGERRLCLRVDSVTDFLLAQGEIAGARIDGAPGGPLRRVHLFDEGGVALWVVERHGADGFEPSETSVAYRAAAAAHYEAFLARPRIRSGGPLADVALFEECLSRICDARATLGEGFTLSLFFRAERVYWQSRNRAARVQKGRQDALGFGWANHDHHTYRSSRHCFHRLIQLMEALGLRCRERFYAGEEAGWGAQVLEHPAHGIVVFADVDLGPDEVAHDFAHAPLPPREGLGTVGLWCALHGESALGAGMHHLECQYDFDAVREQLAAVGVPCMFPFTDLPVLRQAFTVAERWDVDPQRVDNLCVAGALSVDEARRFAEEGALGSHLEVLERKDGYRGFNQAGISDIITQTDPRRAHG